MQISKWVALGVAAFCLVAVGGVVNLAQLYYMAAMLITLPLVSYAIGRWMLRDLVYERQIVFPIWEGEEAEIIYRVTNPSRVPRFSLSVLAPDSANVSAIRMDPPIFHVPAGGTVTVTSVVRFDRRGVYDAGHFDVSAVDPLGVFSFTRTVESPGEVVVFPALRQMDSLDLAGYHKVGMSDSRGQARLGSGVDPSGVRGYQPGDPLRSIHWRQTARTGNLAVIEFEEMQSANLCILLDTSAIGLAGSEPNTTLEFAIRAAAAAARDAVQHGAAVAISAATTAGEALNASTDNGPGRGAGQLYSVFELLARLEAQTSTSMSAFLMDRIGSAMPGATFLIVLLKATPEIAGSVRQWIAAGKSVAVLAVDGATFHGTGSGGTVIHQESIGQIAALGVPVYTLPYNAQGSLNISRLN
jgi:uncharacterized protein (DUF58 family)